MTGQVAIDAAKSSLMLNALSPVGTSGAPGTQLTALAGSPMKLKLTSAASSGASSGTELSGTGYTSGGIAGNTASVTSTSGATVTVPHTTSPFSWTFSFAASIVSLELTDSGATRVWFGNWNGQPIAVASGNTFAVAADAIVLSGF